MLFNCPLSEAKASRLMEVLDLTPSQRVLDVGCGSGEFLMRLSERYGVEGVGIDMDAQSIQRAREAGAARAPRVSFQEVDVADFDAPLESFDCAICLGATHAYALDEPAYPTALRGLMQHVRPGGKILVGEGVWTATPDPEYLAFLGEHTGVYRSHQENVEVAQELGLSPHYSIGTTLDEWDDFEWSHHANAVRAAELLPNNADAADRLARSHIWRQAYLRWGRGTMGFAYYIFTRPLH